MIFNHQIIILRIFGDVLCGALLQLTHLCHLRVLKAGFLWFGNGYFVACQIHYLLNWDHDELSLNESQKTIYKQEDVIEMRHTTVPHSDTCGSATHSLNIGAGSR